MNGTIVFSHGNGFPAGTYRVLFEAWRAAGFTVHALDRFGHDPRYPVTDNWSCLQDQLVDFIQQVAQGPVTLVGHSMGGQLSLLVACRQPALASGVVMLDSPILTGWRAHSWRALKSTGLAHRVSPAKVSHRRRNEWPSVDDAHQRFAAKAVFARWDARVLHDHVEAGIELTDGRARLRFLREVESQVYNTFPHNVDAVMRCHPLRCPAAFIAGTQSNEVHQAGLHRIRTLVGDRLVWLPGSHLFPMEKPDLTAAEVLRQIASF